MVVKCKHCREANNIDKQDYSYHKEGCPVYEELKYTGRVKTTDERPKE